MKRDLLTLADVTPDEIRQMLTLALDLKQRHKRGESTSLLVGKSLVLLFSKPSLRRGPLSRWVCTSSVVIPATLRIPVS